jgi:glycosyltransferase involved in cell wall biosynthesis
LNRSLSVLLPVHNAQATLESDVATVLDVLPELSHEFDVVIIDDASTDATWEIAEDLACRYPQVTIARQPIRQGPATAVRTGARAARGNTVIAHDGHRGVDPQQIVRIWREAEARGICATAMAQRRAVPRPLASAMLEAARSTAIASGGFTLVQPRTVDEIRRDAPSSYERLMRPRLRQTTASAERVGTGLATSNRDPASHSPKTVTPKKPNFLSRIRSRMKEIALGE